MTQPAEWTFEGIPDTAFAELGNDGNRNRYLRGIYVGILKSGLYVNFGWYRGFVNSSQIQETVSGTFYLTAAFPLHSFQYSIITILLFWRYVL